MKKEFLPEKCFYETKAILVDDLKEGSQVHEIVVGRHSTWELAIEAIKDYFLSISGKKWQKFLAFHIEEVLLDSPWNWSVKLPQNYHRSWILNSALEIERSTPGMAELLEHGTTQTKLVYDYGDRVCYVHKDRLRAGVVCGKPRRTHPESLIELRDAGYFNGGIDVTDEYLWYTVIPLPSDIWTDVQLVQTEIFPQRIWVNAARERSLTRFSKEILERVERAEALDPKAKTHDAKKVKGPRK